MNNKFKKITNNIINLLTNFLSSLITMTALILSILLVSIINIPFISPYIPDFLSEWFPIEAYPFLSTVFLIAIFVLLKQNISIKNKEGIIEYDKFNVGFEEIINAAKGSNNYIESVHIFAQGGTYYSQAIGNAEIQIKNLKLLVTDDNVIFKKGEEDGINYKKFSLETWNDNVKRLILNREYIRKYNFFPDFHFAIINNRYLFWGMFKEAKISGENRTGKVYTIDVLNSPSGQAFLNIISKFFDNYYKIGE